MNRMFFLLLICVFVGCEPQLPPAGKPTHEVIRAAPTDEIKRIPEMELIAVTGNDRNVYHMKHNGYDVYVVGYNTGSGITMIKAAE